MLLSSISFDKLIVFFAIVLTIHFDIFFFSLPNPRYKLSSRFVCIARNSAQSSRPNFKNAKARLIRKRRLSSSLCRRVPRDSRKTETKGRKNRHFDVLTGMSKGKEDV